MKHSLFAIDNYLLVVDNSEIKEGDKVLYNDLDILTTDKFDSWFTKWDFVEKSIPPVKYINNCKKIIAHLPLNGAPVLEGVPLLPLLEDEVEKLANEYTSNEKHSGWWAFLRGYNKAKEKYKYTEEDIRAIKRILIYDDDKNDAEKITEVIRVIESLQHRPKLPIAFECEMEVGDYGDKNGLRKFVKTITTSQGETEWVGKYIYE
jgi:hypothetical protein